MACDAMVENFSATVCTAYWAMMVLQMTGAICGLGMVPCNLCASFDLTDAPLRGTEYRTALVNFGVSSVTVHEKCGNVSRENTGGCYAVRHCTVHWRVRKTEENRSGRASERASDRLCHI